MKGLVDDAGRALLTLSVRPNANAPPMNLRVWIDTAFDGELVIPASQIQNLALSQSAAVQATLADGTEVILETFGCQIEWFGEWREVEVIGNEGRLPLLGIGLLRDRRLTIDYRTHDLIVE